MKKRDLLKTTAAGFLVAATLSGAAVAQTAAAPTLVAADGVGPERASARATHEAEPLHPTPPLRAAE